MKLSRLIVVLFVVSSLIISCKKSGNNPNPGGNQNEVWPRDWVLTIEKDATTWKYLHIVGIVINRNDVEKSYPMTDLADEKDCEWEVKQENQVNGKTSYSFHLKKNKNKRLSLGQTADINGNPEWYLGVHEGSTPPNTDQWKFFIHFQTEQDGKKVIQLESAFKPGYFATNTGHTLTANGVKMRNDIPPAMIVCH
jgi:hypothetical protein